MTNLHSFHVPVMGVGFTIDTPIKIAHFGISSVMSIGDDLLAERMRKYYSEKSGKTYIEIKRTEEDYRARRITAYLNLVQELVDKNFETLKGLKKQKGNDLEKYFDLLPNDSDLKNQYNTLSEGEQLLESIKQLMQVGEIEVNIMTKLDRQHYDKEGNPLSREFNDAHSALRGFAKSKLKSGIVLSAGLNPSLYSYIAQFNNFFPNEKGELDKKVILKVSDYRSALVQGKFLAKKGVWVSEYRIESGLNCGGHAFATEGILAGPILEDFKNHRGELLEAVNQVLIDALTTLNKPVPTNPLPLSVTYQGGVGTYQEHQFLIDNYGIDSVGWATPFLLVPEAVNVDTDTRQILAEAGEKELYLSSISPIGVPFNTVRGNSKDVLKDIKTKEGNPGSSCPRQYLKLFNKEFTEQPICLSSKQYQTLKIKELDALNLPEEEYNIRYNQITEKACLCTGLVVSAYMAYDIVTKPDGEGVAVCPGPNLAYFSKISDLKEMVGHIYGKTNLLNETYRPNMFIKELGMYVDYFKGELAKITSETSPKQINRLKTFKENLLTGIVYYQELFDKKINNSKAKEELTAYQNQISGLNF